MSIQRYFVSKKMSDMSSITKTLDVAGATVSSFGGYTNYTFNAGSGNITLYRALTFDILMIAGGGGGGVGFVNNAYGGGGGAGGYIYNSSLTKPIGQYPLEISFGRPGESQTNTAGTSALNTTAFDLSAIGGGWGSCWNLTTSGNGGSSGGGADSSAGTGRGTAVSGQGNLGGLGSSYTGTNGTSSSGGGGGAGGAGGSGSGGTGGSGGIGVQNSITGSLTYYCGGGGGGGSNVGGLGGSGIGGDGSNVGGGNGVAVGYNASGFGSGGGGAAAGSSATPSSAAGGSGSDGIIIFRYASY